MTATLDGVTRKTNKPEPIAEQKVAEELVLAGPGAGPVADRPGRAVGAADQEGGGDGAGPGADRAPRSAQAPPGDRRDRQRAQRDQVEDGAISTITDNVIEERTDWQNQPPGR